MRINIDAYRAEPGKKIRLSSFNPGDTGDFDPENEGKLKAKTLLKQQKESLAKLQTKLYADGRKSLLIVLQALDAGGKDGTIRSIMTGVNPQGVEVTSFKAPSKEELAHDFLWRIHKAAPKKGMIAIFNRSHYEDVLVVRVRNILPKKLWSKRFEMINNFERQLSASETKIVKIYLNISKEEQKERFEERLNNPEKHWKFNPDDLKDRRLWPEYVKAFEDVFNKCSLKEAPWYIVPANRKWYRNVVIAQILIDTLKSMRLRYPDVDFDPSQITIPD